MNTTVQQPVAVAFLFTWTGFVCAISFMEAWLKFRAPGVTLPIGLGIGRLIFSALNKVEWVFTVIVCISAIMNGKPVLTMPNIWIMVIVIILLIQTIWLLPSLDTRAALYINDKPVASSYLHFWFIGAELIKVTALLITGISLLKSNTT